MSVIHDIRSAMQDIIALELREMRTRLDALDERLGRMESQFNQVQHEMKRQHDERCSLCVR